MVWEYKTVLFEFSKDGLLSDRYVDDEEMERNLNQLGQQGWDLVNVSLLQDGLLAFLKRPETGAAALAGLSPREGERAQSRPVQRTTQATEPSPRQTGQAQMRGTHSPRSPLTVENLRERVRQNNDLVPERERVIADLDQDSSDRIGGIRIS